MNHKIYSNHYNLERHSKAFGNLLKSFCFKRKIKTTCGFDKIYVNFENSKFYLGNFEKEVEIGCYIQSQLPKRLAM